MFSSLVEISASFCAVRAEAVVDRLEAMLEEEEAKEQNNRITTTTTTTTNSSFDESPKSLVVGGDLSKAVTLLLFWTKHVVTIGAKFSTHINSCGFRRFFFSSRVHIPFHLSDDYSEGDDGNEEPTIRGRDTREDPCGCYFAPHVSPLCYA